MREITHSSHRGKGFMVNRPLCGLDLKNKCVGDKTLYLLELLF